MQRNTSLAACRVHADIIAGDGLISLETQLHHDGLAFVRADSSADFTNVLQHQASSVINRLYQRVQHQNATLTTAKADFLAGVDAIVTSEFRAISFLYASEFWQQRIFDVHQRTASYWIVGIEVDRAAVVDIVHHDIGQMVSRGSIQLGVLCQQAQADLAAEGVQCRHERIFLAGGRVGQRRNGGLGIAWSDDRCGWAGRSGWRSWSAGSVTTTTTTAGAQDYA